MPAPQLKITVLGSGTSAGVPTIGCHCAVCTSTDPRDKRLRPSILISYEGRNVLVDTTPDFRAQALRAGIDHLDAVIFTHSHADHIMGLDDVRPFNFRQKEQIPIYAAEDTMAAIRRSFQYIFDGKEKESNVPQLTTHIICGAAFELFGLQFIPIPILHGSVTIYGFRFGDAAYLTDHSDIPESSMEQLRGLDVLFLDALRFRPHPTHSTVERSVNTAEKLGARRTFFTHISHDLAHERTETLLPPNVRLAYDGLEILVDSVASRQTEATDNRGQSFRVYRSLAEVPADFGPTALTIGNFDGVHFGHRRILKRMVERAKAQGWKASVLTFDPHPTRVVAPDRAPRLLTSPERRTELMREEGIDQVLILPFNEQLARLTPQEFVRQLLVEKLRARAVLVGDNFRFGHRQSGDVHLLRTLGEDFGFETEIIPAVMCRGHMVSSSGIRQAIQKGHVALAARLLQHPYGLEGDVVKGHGVGSKQTVPTLNLATRAEVIPARGVYVTRTYELSTGREWNSITNVGYRPTFGEGQELSIETFLLDPLEGAPPTRIRVEFLWRVRDERKFERPEALKNQILKDVRVAQNFFRRLRAWVKRPLVKV